jgi:hypothetical protein
LNATKPLLEPFPSSLRLLEVWDLRRHSFGGIDSPDALYLDVPLGSMSTELTAGKREYSPRFSLPAGSWTLQVESEAEATPDAFNLARVSLVLDEEQETVVASTVIVANERAAAASFALPQDERRMRFRADGIQSKARILSVRIRPERLKP